MADSTCAWQDAPRNNAHQEVFARLEYIRKQQSQQREDWQRYAELYSRGNPTGLGRLDGSSYWWGRELEDGSPSVSFNATAAGVDTAFSLIAPTPSIPQFLTTGGDYKLIRQAEKASECLQGQFSEDVRAVGQRAELDALKFGTGFVFQKYDPITGLPGVERELIWNVYVEHLDGFYGKPRCMIRTRIMPKETLKATFPQYASVIDAASGISRGGQSDMFLQGLGAGYSHADFIEVAEAWHLRANAKKKGRHVIAIGDLTIADRPYTHDDFPCAVFRYREREVGYYGAGLVESAEPHQNRIDALIRKIARAQDLASNIIIFNPNGEGSVKAEKFTNDVGLIINYEAMNGAPTLAKWEGTLGDLQAQVDLEVERWLMSEGISASQTNGQGAGKGLDSGTAVRAADDVQSRRLVPYVTRFQQSMMAMARLFVRMNDDCAMKDENYTVMVEGGSKERARFLKTSQWLKVRPPKGDSRLTMAAMSALPTAPQARFAAVQEWLNAGFVSRQYSMQLLQSPDIDAYAQQELAHLDLARWQIEQLLDGFEPMPDPRQDLSLAMDLVTKAKLKLYTMGADEDDIQRFEDWLVYASELMDQAEAQMAPAGPAPGAMPSGAPVGPPMPGVDPMTGLPTQVLAPGLSGMAA